ncbi:MAG: hypothetical protein LBJ08_02570 [Bifidobacteriaceae bacterium]|jgi:hypothetical protein|nr:hypothetical protein [Bifidobacteriaceae bacterium]
MMKRNWIALGAAAALGLGLSVAAGPAGAVTAGATNDDSPVSAKYVPLSVSSRTIKGTHKTGRYVPESFAYSFKVPTLKGTTAKVKKAFDKKIDSLIAPELKSYSKGAATRKMYKAFLAELPAYGSEQGVTRTAAEYKKMCAKNFKPLKQWTNSAVYRQRYVSVVITFSGTNAACIMGLGGMWDEYRTTRSVTMDTVTGEFMDITDFTSNAGGKVTAAVDSWFTTLPKKDLEYFWKNPPVLPKVLKNCDRAGNVYSISLPTKGLCYPAAYSKSGLVAWQVRDKGLRLTFPSGAGVRQAMIPWSKIPRLR